MDLSDRIKRVEFLGAEFITWLWFCESTRGGFFDLGGDLGQVEVSFADRLTMSSTAFDEQEDIFKGGRPTTSLEAQMALRLGKLARQAKLSISQGEQEWQLVLKSAPLMMSAIKLPEIVVQSGQSQFYERMFLLEHLERIYKALYQGFLEERLSDRWHDEILGQINSWVQLGERVDLDDEQDADVS